MRKISVLLLLFFISPIVTSSYVSPLFTHKFHRNWWDKGSGAREDVSVWNTHVNYYMNKKVVEFGYYVHRSHGDPSGKVKMLVANDDPRIMKPPVGYQLMWGDGGSGAREDGSFWWPIAPKGYVTLGAVGVKGHGQPHSGHTNFLRCVRADLVTEGQLTTRIWYDGGSGARWDCSLWKIEAKYNDGVSLNLFYAHRGHNKPNVKVYVLKKSAFDPYVVKNLLKLASAYQ
ncbi:Vps62-related protein, partial [Candidatus Riflebacteria bacterium]